MQNYPPPWCPLPKTLGRKYQVLPYFGICCRELGGSKLRVFAHACTVFALSVLASIEGTVSSDRTAGVIDREISAAKISNHDLHCRVIT